MQIVCLRVCSGDKVLMHRQKDTLHSARALVVFAIGEQPEAVNDACLKNIAARWQQ